MPEQTARQERIEQLWERVEARQRQKAHEQALKAATDLLEATSSLSFLGFLDEKLAVVEPWPAFLRLDCYDERETSALCHDTSTPEQERQWLGVCLAQAGMMEKLYLGFGSLGWAEVQILDPDVHLYPVWSDSHSRDLVLLSPDQTRVLVLSEEEHDYLALIRDVKELLPEKDEHDDWESYSAKILDYGLR